MKLRGRKQRGPVPPNIRPRSKQLPTLSSLPLTSCLTGQHGCFVPSLHGCFPTVWKEKVKAKGSFQLSLKDINYTPHPARRKPGRLFLLPTPRAQLNKDGLLLLKRHHQRNTYLYFGVQLVHIATGRLSLPAMETHRDPVQVKDGCSVQPDSSMYMSTAHAANKHLRTICARADWARCTNSA